MSIISVSNLSKAYRVGNKRERADSFVGMLQDSVTAPFRNWRRMRQPTVESRDTSDELHWALRDVSFEVKEGEVLGVIGRNGAGKSTLLKILSRITEPTSGEVRIRGRVASLLEVGTGFHPELTGRENVYLNGTILGMHKAEIDRKFDEIVDFSGVEKFLDTPVKRFSSGMRVRLAFAVAAHLDPEILIVDEVLAVGDAEFQRRCLGRMRDIASHGKTVLFVSHNLGSIQQLCDKGLLLQNGKIVEYGAIGNVLKVYLASQSSLGSFSREVSSIEKIQVTGVTIDSGPGTPTGIAVFGKLARLTFRLSKRVKDLDLSVTIADAAGYPLVNIDSWRRAAADQLDGEPGDIYSCEINPFPLRAGRYFVSCQLTYQRVQQDRLDDGIHFDVEDGECFGRTYPYASTPGPICIDHTWIMSNSQQCSERQ